MFDIKVKYNTKAADFYRRMNNARALGTPLSEEEPSYDDGRQLTDGRMIDSEGKICERQTDQTPMSMSSKGEMETGTMLNSDEGQIVEENISED